MMKYLKLFVVLMLISCSNLTDKLVKIVELPEDEREKVYLVEDLNGIIDVSQYEIVPNKKGISLPYLKTETANNGISILFRPVYKKNNSNNELLITTSIALLMNEEKAKQLFETNKKIGIMYRKSEEDISLAALKVDDAYCIEDSDKFYLLVRKNKLVYSLDIENLGKKISVDQISESFKTKINIAF